jgi:hypothetical protein
MRFQGNSLDAHAKGACYVCLRADGLVDTDVQIEGEGILAICVGCITAAAEAAGLTFNEAAFAELRSAQQATSRDALVARNEDLTAELAAANAAIVVAENTIETLQDVLDRLGKSEKAKSRAS